MGCQASGPQPNVYLNTVEAKAWTLQLSRAPGEDLGARFAPRADGTAKLVDNPSGKGRHHIAKESLVCIAVEKSGLLPEYACKHIHSAVKVGDKLLALNGETDMAAILDILRSAEELEMRLERGEKCVRPVVAVEKTPESPLSARRQKGPGGLTIEPLVILTIDEQLVDAMTPGTKQQRSKAHRTKATNKAQ